MTYHRIKPRLVNGVHYKPAWAEPGTFVDPPVRKKEEEQPGVGRERSTPQKRVFKRRPEITEAIQKALGTTYSRAITVAILIEANGEIVTHDDLGQTINMANTAIANARFLLGREAVINHTGQGYSLCPDVRRYIIERAGLSDV